MKPRTQSTDRTNVTANLSESGAMEWDPAEIAHDIQNPLTIAQQYLKLARETHDEGHYDEIEDALLRIKAIVEGKIATERYHPNGTERTPLKPVVEQAWQTSVTGENTLKIEWGDERTPQVDIVPLHLRTLLENIFRNSSDHIPQACIVRVGTLRTNPGFYVADNGPGIPTEEREDAFTESYSTNKGGCGLGLHIVAKIAIEYDWDIIVTDSHSGGLRLEFHIPENAWHHDNTT